MNRHEVFAGSNQIRALNGEELVGGFFEPHFAICRSDVTAPFREPFFMRWLRDDTELAALASLPNSSLLQAHCITDRHWHLDLHLHHNATTDALTLYYDPMEAAFYVILHLVFSIGVVTCISVLELYKQLQSRPSAMKRL
jgi:hypothetical protein